MYTHLESTNLLSLLLGYRRQPIIDPDLSKGDTGYTRQRIILKEPSNGRSESAVSTSMSTSTFREPSEPTYITIPEDDIFLFNYDKARLMVLVKEMSHKSYSAHGERGAKNGNLVQYYNDMMSYIFGNTIIDINASENAINNFKINRSNKFAEECVRWERLFEDYQFARNNKPLEEESKLGLLMRNRYDDPRTPWHSTMNHCNLSNMSYDQTIQMLHHACQTTPESMQTVKMCNVSKQSTTASQVKAKPTPPPSTPPQYPITKQYCRNYQTNNCRRTTCRYLHEIGPGSKSITKDDRSDNRSVKQAFGNNRSSNYKSNNSNKRNNNRANDNNNNASMSNSNSGPSHARLNRLQAQEDDFESWSNIYSQGYKNASLNTLSFKRKRLHREAAIEEERQKEIEWDINNSPSPRSRRRRNRRGRSD